VAKAAFNRKTPFARTFDFNLRNKLVKCILGTALYGAVVWTLRKVVQKYLEKFRM
jgi:hypothetical protein